MHMLLTSLSAIYHSRVPIIQYGQRHVDQTSRAHLRYVLTGEIAPWIDKLITYLSDPHNNEDPEPHSKSYSAGGTEMPEQELVKKQQKRKTRQTKQKTPPTQHTHQNNDPNTHKPSNPMLELPHAHPDLDDPHQHINNIDTLSIPYPMEITYSPPKPYKLRPNRVPKTPNTRKRKTHPQYTQHDN